MRVEALDVACGVSRVDLADLAVGHQLRLFQRALDGVDGGLDVHHHAAAQPARRTRTHTDISSMPSSLISATMQTIFGGADVEADNQVFGVSWLAMFYSI